MSGSNEGPEAAKSRLKKQVDDLPPLTWVAIRPLLAYARPHWPALFSMLLFMAGGAAAALPIPLLSAGIIDKAIPSSDRGLLFALAGAILGLTLVTTLAGFFRVLFRVSFRQALSLALREEVFRHALSLPASFFDSEDTGYLMSRVAWDVYQVEGLTLKLVSYVLDGVKLAGGLALLFYLHWKLAGVALAVTPLFLLNILVFRRRVRRVSHDHMEAWGGHFRQLQELFSGILTILAMGRGQEEGRKVLGGVARVFRVEKKAALLGTLSGGLTGLITTLGATAVTALGALEIIDGRFTLGGLVAFGMYLGYVLGPARSLAAMPVQIQPSLVALRRVLAVLSVPPEPGGSRRVETLEGEIALKGVRFTYDGRKRVLDGVSLGAASGEKLGLSGVTGSGKSTLLKLVLGILSPDEGTVTIDGRTVKDYAPASLRPRIGYVPQDPFFFSDTIRANLTRFASESSEADIGAALADAEADGFVAALPQGLDTPIGERGRTLSAGEKQRLALARTYLFSPDILLLDEATSHVDTDTEQRVLDRLLQAFPGRTVLMVSHRASALERMDRVVRLENGRIF